MTVLHLQGFLFFGTITRVEETIHSLVTESAWVRAPIRFLVLDLVQKTFPGANAGA
jgi:sulfate permease, SulP family